MAEENKPVEFEDNELERVAGGCSLKVYFYFKCSACGATSSLHTWNRFTLGLDEIPEHCGQKMVQTGTKTEYQDS